MFSSSRNHNSVPGGGDFLALTTLLNDHRRALAGGNPFLTEAGERHLLQLISLANRDNPIVIRPFWDRIERQLWLGGLLLKSFRQPAPAQQELLDLFEDRGWPMECVSLPRFAADREDVAQAKSRLHATLRNLNHRLPANSVWFHGDGTGLGIRWELLAGPIVTKPHLWEENQKLHPEIQ